MAYQQDRPSTREEENSINDMPVIDGNNPYLSKENVIELVKDIKKDCEHAKNLTLEEIGVDLSQEDCLRHMANQLLEKLNTCKKGEMYQMIYTGERPSEHTFGFICGRSQNDVPYILHYDYGKSLEDSVIKIVKDNAEMRADLQILKVPKLQRAPWTCNYFQLMLMRYMKPKYIEGYLKEAQAIKNTIKSEPCIITIDLGKLPEKLLSNYQTQQLKNVTDTNRVNIGEKIWQDNVNKNYIACKSTKGWYTGEIKEGKVLNEKPQMKIKKLQKAEDTESFFSESPSEIAAECGVKRFFKKLWRKHLKKCWRKIKGFLYGTRFTNNNEANKDLSSEKSNKINKMG